MQDHPGCYCEFTTNISTYNTEFDFLNIVKHGLNWLFRGQGAIATPAATCCAFFNTKKIDDRPNAQIHFSPFTYHYSPLTSLKLPKYSAILTGTCLLDPETRGSVSISERNPFSPPIINHLLWESENDLGEIANALKKLSQIMLSPPMDRYVLNNPIKELSNRDLKLFIKKNSFLGYHASGTCAMGHKGVLNSNLKVKNIDNLRVIDASVMPKIIRGNTNASVIMIAEKGADYILSKK